MNNPYTEVEIPKILFCISKGNSLKVIGTGYILDLCGLLYETLKVLIFYLVLIENVKGRVIMMLLPMIFFFILAPDYHDLLKFKRFKPDLATKIPGLNQKKLNQVFNVIVNNKSWMKLRTVYSIIQILWSFWSMIWIQIYLGWDYVAGIEVETLKNDYIIMLAMEYFSVFYWGFLLMFSCDVYKARVSLELKCLEVAPQELTEERRAQLASHASRGSNKVAPMQYEAVKISEVEAEVKANPINSDGPNEPKEDTVTASRSNPEEKTSEMKEVKVEQEKKNEVVGEDLDW